VRAFGSALLAAALLISCFGAEARPRVRFVTTTSTDNSGLIAYLLQPFMEQANVDVDVVAVGTGQALALGERGDADVVLVHARSREDAFVAAGHGIERRDVMWNDFVIAGPAADPAGVRGETDAPKALRMIAAKKARFVSRGDDSGTHIRELALWEKTGGAPKDELFYLEAGQGMGPCLIIADEKNSYILVDRGTYLAFRKRIDLEVLVEGGAELRNSYGVILVNPSSDAARKLVDYLTSPDGQKRIGDFRVEGEVLFHPYTELE
jgi:tungstate transport system substrate-binding protein